MYEYLTHVNSWLWDTMATGDDFKLLSNVFSILDREGVLRPDPKSAVVNYKDPTELLVKT